MRITCHEWKDIASWNANPAGAGNEDVHVWLGKVPGDAVEISACARLLDGPERLRAERFVGMEARNEFVFGRALLRLLLGGVLRVDPTEVAIGYESRGKPRLISGSAEGDIRFNLAHSNSLVVIALAKGREVGVDVEWTGREMDWPLIAERVFSASELGGVLALPPEQQERAFFAGWTRKEAYLKATGEGLTDEISEIEFTFAPGKPAEVLRLPGADVETVSWEVHEIPLPEGFVGALVVEKGRKPGLVGETPPG